MVNRGELRRRPEVGEFRDAGDHSDLPRLGEIAKYHFHDPIIDGLRLAMRREASIFLGETRARGSSGNGSQEQRQLNRQQGA